MKLTSEMIAADEKEIKELRPIIERLNLLALDSDFKCHFRIGTDITGVAVWCRGESLSAISREQFRELTKENDKLAYSLLRMINKSVEISHETGYRQGVKDQQRALRALMGENT